MLLCILLYCKQIPLNKNSNWPDPGSPTSTTVT